jgi:hypothetical protein
MVDGLVRVRGTFGGFLLFGLSWQHLWWSGNDETRASREIVIPTGQARGAARCMSCDLISFWPDAM